METGYWKNYLQTDKHSDYKANTYGKEDFESRFRNESVSHPSIKKQMMQAMPEIK